jgi:hypothetical protein
MFLTISGRGSARLVFAAGNPHLVEGERIVLVFVKVVAFLPL